MWVSSVIQPAYWVIRLRGLCFLNAVSGDLGFYYSNGAVKWIALTCNVTIQSDVERGHRQLKNYWIGLVLVQSLAAVSICRRWLNVHILLSHFLFWQAFCNCSSQRRHCPLKASCPRIAGDMNLRLRKNVLRVRLFSKKIADVCWIEW